MNGQDVLSDYQVGNDGANVEVAEELGLSIATSGGGNRVPLWRVGRVVLGYLHAVDVGDKAVVVLHAERQPADPIERGERNRNADVDRAGAGRDVRAELGGEVDRVAGSGFVTEAGLAGDVESGVVVDSVF